VLRAYSVDELPQLINVIRGDMSLVGPRPVVTSELTRYGNAAVHYLSARPGITGLWQVSGRSDTTYRARVSLDAHYVTGWSLAGDIAHPAEDHPRRHRRPRVLLSRTGPDPSMARGASQAAGDGLAHLTARRTRASVAGVAWNLLTVGLSSALALSVFLITSRVLAPSDFGAVALAVAIVSIVSMLVPVAFGEALIQRKDLQARHLDSVFWLTLAVAGGLYGGLVVSATWFANWMEVDVLAAILPVLGLRILFDALLTVPGSLVTRRMQFRYTALRSLLANAVAAGLCVWLVLEGFALWALVLSQIANSFVAMVVSFLAARWRPGRELSATALRELGFFGLYAMGGRILSQARLDHLVLGVVLGPATLGLYYFAQRLFRMLGDLTSGVFGPVTNVLMASLQAEPDKRRKAFQLASFASAGLAFPVFGGLIVLAPLAVPVVFGPQWTEAVFALQCFAVMGMLNGVGIVQAALIRNLGRPDWWFWYQIVQRAVVLAMIPLVAPLGLDAIMTALVLLTLLFWPLSVRQAQVMLSLSLRDYLGALRGPAIATCVMAGAILASWDPTAGLRGAGQLALLVALGAFVYAATLAAISSRSD
jgi:teichuronic acid exporter